MGVTDSAFIPSEILECWKELSRGNLGVRWLLLAWCEHLLQDWEELNRPLGIEGTCLEICKAVAL